MGRITIFNTISAVISGAIGAGIGSLFGKEGSQWGMLVGGVSGFVFPFWPVVLVTRIVELFKHRRSNSQTAKHDEQTH